MERGSSLGGRLRRLMEEEGLSYEQLGERLGMNPQTLNRYVLGQREPKIGTASAMAAAALVSLLGGSPEQMAAACATALQNLLGLVCDPVAGLVEVPCVKRNVIGAVNAVSAADMALAGIESRVPVDQVIDCMGDVGRRLPVELRETALGGLAATPFGQSVKAKREERRSQEQEL